jgi:hypothetical protein
MLCCLSTSYLKFKVSYPVPKLLILVDSRDDYKAQRVHGRPQGHLGVPNSLRDIPGFVFFHPRDLGGGSCFAEF